MWIFKIIFIITLLLFKVDSAFCNQFKSAHDFSIPNSDRNLISKMGQPKFIGEAEDYYRLYYYFFDKIHTNNIAGVVFYVKNKKVIKKSWSYARVGDRPITNHPKIFFPENFDPKQSYQSYLDSVYYFDSNKKLPAKDREAIIGILIQLDALNEIKKEKLIVRKNSDLYKALFRNFPSLHEILKGEDVPLDKIAAILMNYNFEPLSD